MSAQHLTCWSKTSYAVIPTGLTLLAAGLMGGGIAADVTVMVVIAAVVLIVVGIFNGVKTLVSLCELRRE